MAQADWPLLILQLANLHLPQNHLSSKIAIAIKNFLSSRFAVLVCSAAQFGQNFCDYILMLLLSLNKNIKQNKIYYYYNCYYYYYYFYFTIKLQY